MSPTAKTLGSLGLALLGLLIYIGVFLGVSAFQISALGAVVYLALLLCFGAFVLVVSFAITGEAPE